MVRKRGPGFIPQNVRYAARQHNLGKRCNLYREEAAAWRSGILKEFRAGANDAPRAGEEILSEFLYGEKEEAAGRA